MMKKIFFLGVLGCMALSSQATILRVSNVEGNTAPYAKLADAYANAAAGDTIVLDGSPNNYGDLVVDSVPVTIMGHGYFLLNNGITQSNNSDACVGVITVQQPGTVIRNLTFSDVSVMTSNVVVTQCNGGSVHHGGVKDGGYYSDIAHTNIVIHQNILGRIRGRNHHSGEFLSQCQITNNILTGTNGFMNPVICNIKNSLIQYNTEISYNKNGNDVFVDDILGCEVNDNIHLSGGMPQNGESNNFIGEHNVNHSIGHQWKLDSGVKEATDSLTNLGYGAFAGDDPYVISGVPAGPVIESIDMPVSVEKGKTLDVVVKIKIQK